MNKFVKCIGYIAIATIGTIFNAYVLSVLWQWFIVSTFALPAIGTAQAVGLCMIVGYMTKQYVEDGRKFSDQVALMLAKPALFLFIGWIVTKFL